MCIVGRIRECQAPGHEMTNKTQENKKHGCNRQINDKISRLLVFVDFT